ncbi:MAG: trypsin-like peptidase domain-containing protein [Actinomycetota bacterium]
MLLSVKVTTNSGGDTGSVRLFEQTPRQATFLQTITSLKMEPLAEQFSVEFSNGDTTPATIVGRDSVYDLAVLKIQKGNLSVIPFGDSSKLSIG